MEFFKLLVVLVAGIFFVMAIYISYQRFLIRLGFRPIFTVGVMSELGLFTFTFMAQCLLVLLVELLGSFREKYFLKLWQLNNLNNLRHN